MTEEEYLKFEDTIKNGGVILDSIRSLFGVGAGRDYTGNSDIPSRISCSSSEMDIFNYYYFWFPLVKESLK